MRRRGNGAIRLGMAFALLFSSLSLVVWRQSRALEELRSLEQTRAERALLQAERSSLQREVQYLESRPRVLEVAAERLGMRLPVHTEIVVLMTPAHVDGSAAWLAAAEPRGGEDRR